jgi:hypothetical protein
VLQQHTAILLNFGTKIWPATTHYSSDLQTGFCGTLAFSEGFSGVPQNIDENLGILYVFVIPLSTIILNHEYKATFKDKQIKFIKIITF